MTNEQLLREYRRTKNDDLLGTLYEKNEKLLWRIAHEYNVDIDETYLGFMKAIQKFDETKGNFTTLVYTCCRNEILMARRKRQVDTISLEEKTTDNLTIGDIIEDTHDLMQDIENKQLIENFMGVLTEEEKEIIQHYYFDDFTLEKIGVIMGLSFRQVQAKHKKALAKMEKAYNESEWGFYGTNSYN